MYWAHYEWMGVDRPHIIEQRRRALPHYSRFLYPTRFPFKPIWNPLSPPFSSFFIALFPIFYPVQSCLSSIVVPLDIKIPNGPLCTQPLIHYSISLFWGPQMRDLNSWLKNPIHRFPSALAILLACTIWESHDTALDKKHGLPVNKGEAWGGCWRMFSARKSKYQRVWGYSTNSSKSPHILK